MNEPSKSDEYMVVNRSLLLGRAGNTLLDAVCFPRMTFADLALSRASFTTASLSASIATVSGPGGVNLAFAERERGLSRVLGRCFKSAIAALFVFLCRYQTAGNITDSCTCLCLLLRAHDLQGGARTAHLVLVARSTRRF